MRFVANDVNGAAQNQIADEAVSMRGHRDQITVLGLGELDDFRRRITERQMHRHGNPRSAEFPGAFVEVAAVGEHFLRLGELQLIEMTRGPAIGDVNEQQLRAEQLRQLPHMRQQALVGAAVFERDKNFFVHE